MSKQLLNDPDVSPTSEVLENVLGEKYSVFREFITSAESEEFKLKPEWRFYKDGKAWLCKITHKKKTVVWLSIWSDCLKFGFYFTEKTGEGISGLRIDESLKDFYLNHKPIGKLKPVVIDVKARPQLEDLYTLIRYKISKL